MKRTVLAAAIALPLAAAAQSSVTLYGRLNISAESLHFSSTPTRSASRLNVLTSDASLWGMRGVEDLGGGLRAYFKLESDFQVDSGALTSNTQVFSRESYVGLGSGTWGSLQLGSQWAPGLWQSLRADPFQRFGPGGQPYLLQGARGYTLRYDNAIQYLTPTFAGLSGRAYYAAGEGQPTGRATAASVDYDHGPVYAGAFYENTLASAASVGLPGTGGKTSRTASFAGSYDFGVVRLSGQYQTNKTEGVPDAKAYLVGVTVPIGAGQIRTSYLHRSAPNADASLMGAGYWYYLSKRTQLFVNVARLANDGTAAFRMGPAIAEQAALGPAGPGAGQDTTGFQVGVMHFF